MRVCVCARCNAMQVKQLTSTKLQLVSPYRIKNKLKTTIEWQSTFDDDDDRRSTQTVNILTQQQRQRHQCTLRINPTTYILTLIQLKLLNERERASGRERERAKARERERGESFSIFGAEIDVNLKQTKRKREKKKCRIDSVIEETIDSN